MTEYASIRIKINKKMNKNTIYSNGEEIELVSISQALRRHVGRMRIRGMITSISKLFKMISGINFYCNKCVKLTEINFESPLFSIKNEDKKCSFCGKPIKEINYNYSNAVQIELQDLDSFNDLDRLPVFLFDQYTENVRVGETILVEGQIHIAEHQKTGKKLFPCFYAESIQYDKDKNIELTKMDIDSIRGFTKIEGSKLIDALVKMFDRSIIGYDHVKKGLLLCAVNSAADMNSYVLRRERIHALLVGPPGLAKTRLLKSATKLIPNSRFESGQNSSGKSLTAIVSKEDDNYVLRLGPVSLAKNALCAINEFGRTTFIDQAHLLDVMEEGQFTINKHGINATIKAPTTVIASANPTNNSTWKTEDSIDINEIPALKPIIDRVDLTFVFRGSADEYQIREYAYKKSEFETKKIPDYSSYLIKHLEYAKRFNPIISDEAKIMLNEFFVKIKTHNFGSNRILDSLFRTAKAFARLQLKHIVDEKIAKETMNFYNVILLNYQEVTKVSDDPRDTAYEECVGTLRQIKFGITLDELLRTVCEKNEQVKRYLTFGNRPLRCLNFAKSTLKTHDS